MVHREGMDWQELSLAVSLCSVLDLSCCFLSVPARSQ